jgi:hypothetical protein
MPRLAFQIFFFVCLGMTCEIFFTAFTNLINNEPFCDEPLWSLTGKTYVWMAFIYGLIPVFARELYGRMFHLSAPLRLLVYVALIYAVEFGSGFVLEQLTGKCPWEYTTGLQVMGYIRLDYFPAWMFFAFFVEKLYLFIDAKF